MRLIKSLILLSLAFGLSLLFAKPIQATYDPISVPNNKYGIHLISPTDDEINPATQLVNSTGGEWGYVTILIEENDRKTDKWQTFFNTLRRRHIIPIVRLATKPTSDYWSRPSENSAQEWADFLDSLNWPTKNRYVIVYNEPNHGKEWGNSVDPASYAKVLDQTISTLKAKNSDFFVLNAGLDASTPYEPPAYMDEESYLRAMNEAVPGIFNKLDGWVSHSYPNPGFVAPPSGQGKGSIKTYEWEIDLLKDFGLNRDLPIFITETGWKHSDGKTTINSLPSPETVASYYQTAFTNIWNHPKIVAITPFLLNYQEEPFSHFSFKRYNNGLAPSPSTGRFPDYHPQYQTIVDLPKTAGKPVQEHKAKLVGGIVYPAIVSGEKYNIHLTFENVGQSIWNDSDPVSLQILSGQDALGAKVLDADPAKVEPGGTKTFNLELTAPQGGDYNLIVNMYQGSQPFNSEAIAFHTEVKAPVNLQIKSKLKWKKDSSGEFLLSLASDFGGTLKYIALNAAGESAVIEDRTLIPDQQYEFTLQKPFYLPKTIRQVLHSGENVLDFGTLTPNIPSAILRPTSLWNLLPFSN